MTKSELVRMAVFEGKHIRKILHEGEWWFAVIDIVEVLTGSSIPKRYWSDSEGFSLAEAYHQRGLAKQEIGMQNEGNADISKAKELGFVLE